MPQETDSKKGPASGFLSWQLELHHLTDGRGLDCFDETLMLKSFQKGESATEFLANSAHPRSFNAKATLGAIKDPRPKTHGDFSTVAILVTFFIAIGGIVFYIAFK